MTRSSPSPPEQVAKTLWSALSVNSLSKLLWYSTVRDRKVVPAERESVSRAFETGQNVTETHPGYEDV